MVRPVNEPDFSGEPQSRGALGLPPDQPQLPAALARQMAARLPPPPKYGVATRLFWVLCLAAFVVGLWQLGPMVAERYQYASTRGKVRAEYEQAREFLQSSNLPQISMAYEAVARKIRPSVVSIKCTRNIATGLGRAAQLDGQGSGVIIDPDGFIITNAHVVAGATYIEVILHDRQSYSARLVGIDQTTDLAVIKIPAQNLIAAEWGESDELKVGSLVWAIGSPFGLDQSVTSGIISGRNRYEQNARSNTPQQELLQTDAAVNPGNSGGALVDSRGNLVGINTAIVGEAFQGISFAVPSAVAKFVSDQLIRHGRVTRGFLGITPYPVTPEHRAKWNLPDLNGAILVSVEPDTPGYAAGFRPGDVIRAWNGHNIEDYLLIYRLVAMTPPHEEAVVDLIRDGQPLTVKIRVGERPESFDRPRPR